MDIEAVMATPVQHQSLTLASVLAAQAVPGELEQAAPGSPPALRCAPGRDRVGGVNETSGLTGGGGSNGLEALPPSRPPAHPWSLRLPGPATSRHQDGWAPAASWAQAWQEALSHAPGR